MALRKLVIYPDPRLKERCGDVSSFDSELHTLLDDMRETMITAVGVGLAAPQIGVQKRIAVIDVSEEQNQPIELINPEIIAATGSINSEEGCLSIPRYRDTISRRASVTVKAQNRHGDWFEVGGDGLLSMCLQHEIDHLNGILFIDHLSRIKREFFRRWLKKQGGVLVPEE
jgi:peptide deformylase